MKWYNRNSKEYEFCCDKCQKLAGSNANEQKALELARKTAKNQGWKWEHPGWKLYCPDCQ